MVQTAAYAPVPKPRPRISRDRTAVVLAAVAVLPVMLGIPLLSWAEGRVNSTGFALLPGILLLLSYPVAGFVLLGRVLIRFLDGTPMQRVRWLLLLVAAASPILVCYSRPPHSILFGGYMGGFISWTRANVEAKAIRQWGATVPLDATRGTAHPDYWMGRSLPGILFVPVGKYAWPVCISRTKPKEVYVLGDRSAVILYWPSGRGWYRAIIIAANEEWSPPQDWLFLNDLGQGIWVCIRGPT